MSPLEKRISPEPFETTSFDAISSVFDSTMVVSSVSFGLLTPDSKALNEKLALLLLRFAGDGELAAAPRRLHV